MHEVKALVFDAFGTLFDVHSVVEECEKHFPGQGITLSEMWRAKQLEYSWLRSIMGRYADFWQITAQGLEYALATLEIEATPAQIEAVLHSYDRLNLFPDVLPTLEQLHVQGVSLNILSNGTPAMLQNVVTNAGIGHLLQNVLSVDELQVYKPDPRVYQSAVDKLGLSKEDIGFVSSNSWDAAGAKSFGLRVFWLSRRNRVFDRMDVEPDATIRVLHDLYDLPV